jgi:hypothetical protein
MATTDTDSVETLDFLTAYAQHAEHDHTCETLTAGTGPCAYCRLMERGQRVAAGGGTSVYRVPLNGPETRRALAEAHRLATTALDRAAGNDRATLRAMRARLAAALAAAR